MVSLASFAHPAVSDFSVVGIVLAPFIFAANMFGFVLAVRNTATVPVEGLHVERLPSSCLSSRAVHSSHTSRSRHRLESQ